MALKVIESEGRRMCQEINTGCGCFVLCALSFVLGGWRLEPGAFDCGL